MAEIVATNVRIIFHFCKSFGLFVQLMDKKQAGFYSFLNVCHKKLTTPLEGGGDTALHTVLLVFSGSL